MNLWRMPLVYRLCKRYVDWYNNENNDNVETNGELRLMQRVLPQSRIVFDIGANVGLWVLRALAVNPHITLHCFEPSYATYQRLLSNRFPPNVVCNNFGMGAAVGEMTLFVFEDGSGANSLYRREGLKDGWGLAPQQRQETVHLETVESYCQTQGIGEIDFCKVDVEGHELQVLIGMTSLLRTGSIKIIQFEYGGCNIDARVLLKDIFTFFRPFDYILYKIYPTYLRRVERYDQRLENFQYQNYVAVVSGYPGLIE